MQKRFGFSSSSYFACFFCSCRVVSTWFLLLPASLAFPAFPFVLHNYALSCESSECLFLSLPCLAWSFVFNYCAHFSNFTHAAPLHHQQQQQPQQQRRPVCQLAACLLRCLMQVPVASGSSTHYHYHRQRPRQRQLHYAHYTFHFEWFSRSIALFPYLSLPHSPSSFVVWEKFCSWHRFVIFMAKHFHRKFQRQRETSLSDLQALSLSFSKILAY